MKAAVCFSGHLRSFLNTYQYLKPNIIDPMHCDVFIHTWDTLGGSSNRGKGDGDASSYKLDIDKVYQLVKPTSFSVESEETIKRFVDKTNHIMIPDNERCFIAGHIANHVSMFYSIYKANQLKCEFEKLNNFKYDRVIRVRGDLRIAPIFNLNLFPDNDTLYVPIIGKYCEEGINDQIAVSNSNIMDQYCEIYTNIISYYQNNIVIRRPEAILHHHLISKGIKIQEIDIPYDVYRFDGSILRQHRFGVEILGARWR